MDKGKCYICDWISRRNDNEKKYFIGELETGYIFFSNRWQYFKGYTFFISKICAGELQLLPQEFRAKYLMEMAIVSEAVQSTFHAKKINCESLGNSCSHIHWHIIPRYGTDPCPDKAIWNINREIIESVTMDDAELERMRDSLITELKRLVGKYGMNAYLNEERGEDYEKARFI